MKPYDETAKSRENAEHYRRHRPRILARQKAKRAARATATGRKPGVRGRPTRRPHSMAEAYAALPAKARGLLWQAQEQRRLDAEAPTYDADDDAEHDYIAALARRMARADFRDATDEAALDRADVAEREWVQDREDGR